MNYKSGIESKRRLHPVPPIVSGAGKILSGAMR